MSQTEPIVNFSLRKEVFFVVIGSFIGAFTMHLPRMFLDLFGEASYTTTLRVMAQTVQSYEPQVGFVLHIFVATVIGITTGLFLHKIIKFNLSKFPRGILYGVIAGIVVFVVFAIPVSQFILNPNLEVVAKQNPEMTIKQIKEEVNVDIISQLTDMFYMHVIWGVTLGAVTSLLTRKIGANYLCHKCKIEFAKLSTWEHHQENVHDNPSDEMKKILILGGGYSGINVLNKIQEKFQDDVNISISLISESNFFLHTPMLPEMATGTIEPRHIATPIREFCKRATFYQATISKIDLKSKKVSIKSITGNKEKELSYDFLVLALGSKTNFFGNKNIEKNSFTIKSLDDAIKIRNHVISVLEEADQEEDKEKQQRLVTFVVVGGGFSGVETVGELNDYVRETVDKYYRNIPKDAVKVVLIAAGDEILPEIGKLGEYTNDALKKAGVTIHTNTKLDDIKDGTAILDNNEKIYSDTIIWAGGIKVDDVIKDIETEHHKSGKIIVNKHLKLESNSEVFALGDCAYIIDPRTDKPYPPTAQHAIRESKIASDNLINMIQGVGTQKDFIYDTKGTMAKIGKKDGVAMIAGHPVKGFLAWLVWKQYYLATLPTMEKRIRVGLDWFIDLFFPRDITRLSSISEK